MCTGTYILWCTMGNKGRDFTKKREVKEADKKRISEKNNGLFFKSENLTSPPAMGQKKSNRTQVEGAQSARARRAAKTI